MSYPLVIVAGGRGTRLGGGATPKSMVEIGSVPLVEHQIRVAASCRILKIYLLLGHGAEHIIAYIGDGARFGVHVEYLVEEAPLGTGGCIGMLAGRINSPFFVIFGDIFAEFDFRRLESFFHQNTSSNGMVAVVHPNTHPMDSDLLAVDGCSRVLAIRSRPHCIDEDFNNLVNAAIFLLRPSIFPHVSRRSPCDLVVDGIESFLSEKGELWAYKTSEYIRDIGTPKRLSHVREQYRAGIPQRRRLSSPQRAIFLDRDGTLIRFVYHLAHQTQVELLPEAADAVSLINGSDYLAIIATNQPGIAKGFFTLTDLDRINRRVETLLGRQGAYLDDIFFCPHHPQTGFPGENLEFKKTCNCRKPKPGMLESAARKHNISLPDSWMIGDSDCDIRAAVAAGCRAIRIGEGVSRFGEIVVSNLAEGVRLAITGEENSPETEKSSLDMPIGKRSSQIL